MRFSGDISVVGCDGGVLVLGIVLGVVWESSIFVMGVYD